jgi:hypothetical protein
MVRAVLFNAAELASLGAFLTMIAFLAKAVGGV